MFHSEAAVPVDRLEYSSRGKRSALVDRLGKSTECRSVHARQITTFERLKSLMWIIIEARRRIMVVAETQRAVVDEAQSSQRPLMKTLATVQLKGGPGSGKDNFWPDDLTELAWVCMCSRRKRQSRTTDICMLAVFFKGSWWMCCSKWLSWRPKREPLRRCVYWSKVSHRITSRPGDSGTVTSCFLLDLFLLSNVSLFLFLHRCVSAHVGIYSALCQRSPG